MKRIIAIDILAMQGVSVGDSFAYQGDDVVERVLAPFLKSPPPPGTVIEVEYGQTRLYRRPGVAVS